jgi:hypothetical protein
MLAAQYSRAGYTTASAPRRRANHGHGASNPSVRRRRRHGHRRPFPGIHGSRWGPPPALRHQAERYRRSIRLLQAQRHWYARFVTAASPRRSRVASFVCLSDWWGRCRSGCGWGESRGGLLPREETAGRHPRATGWLPR